jgi:hypothetical protein
MTSLCYFLSGTSGMPAARLASISRAAAPSRTTRAGDAGCDESWRAIMLDGVETAKRR